MSPEAQTHLLLAIERGPAFLPDDLLEGARPAQYRALRAYANTISHARHVAMEDTFPRLRDALGAEKFHAFTSRHLEGAACRRPLRLIGAGFAELLDTPQARDLARIDWAWLEAHGASDAPALLLERLKGASPDRLVVAKVRTHPAARIVALEEPQSLQVDVAGDGDHLLITRPEAEVSFTRVSRHEAELLTVAARPTAFGTLLERHAEAATTLVKTGALRPLLEIVP